MLRSWKIIYKRRNHHDAQPMLLRVAGTVGLASTAVMGIDSAYKGPLEPVYRAALGLGTANQLTNILRDVGEDAVQRDRIYLPCDELARFNISEADVRH